MGLSFVSALAAAAIAASVTTSSDDESKVHAACADLIAHAEELAPTQFRKLTELPPGTVTHAVYRVVRGCPVAEVLVGGQIFYAPSSVLRDGGPVVGSRIGRRDHPGH